jgi:sugar phosphate isomerase/epimerase
MNDPRIHLAVDNCFASKRWTEPAEWAELAADMGLHCIEASADNECDPFYAGPEFLADWRERVKDACAAHGVRVANLYSGHGTYATLGLTHTDERVRDRMLNGWLKTMTESAADLEAGLGFFCHAFSQAVLADPEAYSEALEDLYDRLAELARYGAEAGARYVSLEQMYTPHQVPWRVAGARELMRQVKARGGDMYLSIDAGHASGQRKFLRPSRRQLVDAVKACSAGRGLSGTWAGTLAAYDALRAAAEGERALEDAVNFVEEQFDERPYLCAEESDGDPYEWIEQLGRYSPILHLQQTDGEHSSHWPFTEEYNKIGIVKGKRLLRTLARSCAQDEEPDMPPPSPDIYLTIEVFSSTADLPVDIHERMQATADYWRRFVPEDGKRLSELVG